MQIQYTVNAINEHASKQLDKTNHSAILGAYNLLKKNRDSYIFNNAKSTPFFLNEVITQLLPLARFSFTEYSFAHYICCS